MAISGFTMVRNATRFYFPVKESIISILPIVDEFIVALGKGDADDKTEEEILSIGSPKVKIIHREWDETRFKNSAIFRDETNEALSHCKGDWCFYIQADEVVHEEDLITIKEACKNNLNNKNVEGFLFNYLHFWGDYGHYLPFHGWYRNEIRIIRNNIGIESIKDAQSFRKANNSKLDVLPINARIFHYGWVRPPDKMKSKKKEHDNIHRGKTNDNTQQQINLGFDYGPLGRIPLFKSTHPAVMNKRITEFYWGDKLNYSRNFSLNYEKQKHERFKYRLISWFENKVLGGKQLFGYSNWNIIK
jgi:hypothetical protein